MVSRFAAALLAPSLVLAAIAPALAQPAETHSVAVSVAGLDLATPAGAAALARRIDHAAAVACGIAPGARISLEQQVRDDACRAQAKADAGALAQTRIAAARSSRLYAMDPAGKTLAQ
jgi:UrcA family protein